MASGSTPKSEAVERLKINEQKWSKPLMDAGWTVIPNVIIERQKALGLDALDVNILLHLASYWWTADNKPRPAKATVADALQIDPRTVQRRIARLEAANLIRREQRRIPGKGSRPNLYHFDGLIAAAQPFAQEKLKEIAARVEEREKRVQRKRPTIRLVSNNDDDEE